MNTCQLFWGRQSWTNMDSHRRQMDSSQVYFIWRERETERDEETERERETETEKQREPKRDDRERQVDTQREKETGDSMTQKDVLR